MFKFANNDRDESASSGLLSVRVEAETADGCRLTKRARARRGCWQAKREPPKRERRGVGAGTKEFVEGADHAAERRERAAARRGRGRAERCRFSTHQDATGNSEPSAASSATDCQECRARSLPCSGQCGRPHEERYRVLRVILSDASEAPRAMIRHRWRQAASWTLRQNVASEQAAHGRPC